MSLPPERISIKRRRQEEPVETLYLEDNHTSNKRRFTEYCFRRIQNDDNGFIIAQDPFAAQKPALDTTRCASFNTAARAPAVQTSLPGAEVRDGLQRRLLRETRLKELNKHLSSTPDEATVSAEPPNIASDRLVEPRVRRFHLSRSSTPLSSARPLGITKRKQATRSPLATFIEVHGKSSRRDIEHRPKDVGVVDRILYHASHGTEQSRQVPPFLKTSTDTPKTGQSLTDHPSTWDHGSEQLASELAAFALEISGESTHQPGPDRTALTSISDNNGVFNSSTEADGAFVYETYVRVPRILQHPDNSEQIGTSGVLVIEEQDEELWHAFAEDDDDDSEWDEEDADSNAEDNPANDYPDDELSSNDEHSYGVYRYRNGASDDEEYDFDNHD